MDTAFQQTTQTAATAVKSISVPSSRRNAEHSGHSVLTVGGPPGVCDADRVAGMAGRVGLQEFHAVRRVPLGGELGHHKLLVVVYGAHAG